MLLKANRRRFLTGGLAVALLPFDGPAIRGATGAPAFFAKPLAGSRAVSTFAKWLICDWSGPPRLLDAIEAELDRPAVPFDGAAQERARAEYLALFVAMRVAPRHLRRAGYDAAAGECEAQRDLGKGGSAPGRARYDIGRENRGVGCMPPLVQIAYGCAAHASLACSHAGSDDMRVVLLTGEPCARAVRSPIFGEDVYPYITDPAEELWAYGAAVHAINAAMAIGTGGTARP